MSHEHTEQTRADEFERRFIARMDAEGWNDVPSGSLHDVARMAAVETFREMDHPAPSEDTIEQAARVLGETAPEFGGPSWEEADEEQRDSLRALVRALAAAGLLAHTEPARPAIPMDTDPNGHDPYNHKPPTEKHLRDQIALALHQQRCEDECWGACITDAGTAVHTAVEAGWQTARPVPSPATTSPVLAEIAQERARQDAKWGEQNHPDIYTEADQGAIYQEFARDADHWKDVNAERVADGNPAWDGILLEEVYEALAEANPAKRRAELIQVAGVAVNWVEAIDRREGSPGTTSEPAATVDLNESGSGKGWHDAIDWLLNSRYMDPEALEHFWHMCDQRTNECEWCTEELRSAGRLDRVVSAAGVGASSGQPQPGDTVRTTWHDGHEAEDWVRPSGYYTGANSVERGIATVEVVERAPEQPVEVSRPQEGLQQ